MGCLFVVVNIRLSYEPLYGKLLGDALHSRIGATLSYIEANRSEVEEEYQIVLKQSEENRQYWENRNREHVARHAAMQPKPGREALWEKLQAQKARHDLEA